jgi:hypothetical protein
MYPNVSTARWTVLPVRCVAPSEPARCPCSGLACPTWLRVPLVCQPHDHVHIVHDGLTDACSDPALRVLRHRCPRRQMLWHHAPVCTGSHEPTPSIEHLAHGMVPLRSLLRHHRQVWGDTRPYLIAFITGRGVSFHTLLFPKVQNRLDVLCPQLVRNHRQTPSQGDAARVKNLFSQCCPFRESAAVLERCHHPGKALLPG